jgi:hypothetical protein
MKPFVVHEMENGTCANIITYITLFKNENINGFFLYIGRVFGNLNVI